MNTQSLSLLFAVGLFVAGLLSTVGYAVARIRRSSQPSWNDLLAKLASTDHGNIALVALDFVDETGAPRHADEAATLEPAELWKLVGGLKGLEHLEANSDVLIDMAAYLERWHSGAAVIAEGLRRDARELKWHVARLRGAAQTGNLQISFPFYAQRAVVTYYLMTRRVLELYRLGNFAILADPAPDFTKPIDLLVPGVVVSARGCIQRASWMATKITRPRFSISFL